MQLLRGAIWGNLVPFLENCIERTTAIAAACGWLALGGGIEATVGVVVGASGLAAAVASVARRHGPESRAALNAIRKRVADDLQRFEEVERWDNAQDYYAADAALERALAGCFLDRRALAESARDPGGFPMAATKIVLKSIADREPDAFGKSAPPIAREFAEVVVRTALDAAIENEDYFKGLEPHLLLEMLKGVGTLEIKIEALHQDVRETLAVVRQMQPPTDPISSASMLEVLKKQNLLLLRQIRSEIVGEVLDRYIVLAAAVVGFLDTEKLVHHPEEMHDAPWDALIHIASFICDFAKAGETPGRTLLQYIESADLGQDVKYETYLALQYITLPATEIWSLVRDAWSIATTPELAGDQLSWERSQKIRWLWEQFPAYLALEKKVESGIASGVVPASELQRDIVGAILSPPEVLKEYLVLTDDKPWSYETWWPKV